MKKLLLILPFLISLVYAQSVNNSNTLYPPVKYATVSVLPPNSYSVNIITGTNNADTLWVDGFKPVIGDRVLVKNETTSANNGIYTLTQQAAAALPFILTRATFSSIAPNLTVFSQVYVQYGKTNAGSTFYLNALGGITVGSTGISFPSNKTYLDKGYPLNNGFVVVGTSIEAGFCAGCSGSLTKPWPDYLASYFGLTSYTNYAVASTGPRRACYQIGTNIGAQKTGALLSGSNFNYSRVPVTGDTTHRYSMIRSANHRLAALQFTNTIQFYRQGNSSAVNPNITTSGSAPTALVIDTLKDFCSAAVYYVLNDPNNTTMNVFWRPSTTLNETITIINVAGANLGIGVAGFSLVAPASRVQVTVDGSVVQTYDPNDKAIDVDLENGFFHRLGFIPDEIVVTGLRDTLHTVVLTFLDAGKIGYFDHIASLKNPPACVTIPFYITDNLHMNSTGLNLTGGSNDALDSSSNSIRADMANIYGSFPVFFTNANYPSGLYDPSKATQIQTDGVHPWEQGPANIATSYSNSFNQKIANTYVNGIGSLMGGTAGSIPYLGTGGALRQSNSNFFWDSTNNRLGINTTSPIMPFHVKNPSASSPNIALFESTNAASAAAVIINATSNKNTILQFQNAGAGVWYAANVGAAGANTFVLQNSDANGNATVLNITQAGDITTLGSLTLPVAKALKITEGSNGRVGQVALTSGTKAVSITGLTTSSRAFISLVSQSGTSTTTYQYVGVCTSNTLTITAITTTGSTVGTDASTVNYFVINSMNDWIALAICLGLIRPFFRRKSLQESVLNQAA